MLEKTENMKKNYDLIANTRNTPHLRENTLIILFSYFSSGLNFLVLGWYAYRIADAFIARLCILVGIIMLCMVPISFVDKRKEMKGLFAAISAAIMHLAFCIAFSFIISFWWIAIYMCEAVLCVICILASRKSL